MKGSILCFNITWNFKLTLQESYDYSWIVVKFWQSKVSDRIYDCFQLEDISVTTRLRWSRSHLKPYDISQLVALYFCVACPWPLLTIINIGTWATLKDSSGQTAHLHKLIWIITGPTCPNLYFLLPFAGNKLNYSRLI